MSDDRDRYLDLMKRILTNVIYQDPPTEVFWLDGKGYNAERRENGVDWPTVAHTMVGRKRLDNLQDCVERVIADGVPGDLIETGVWRGGVTIFMRALLAAYDEKDRTVWVADSFEGIPDSTTGDERDRKIALDRFNDVLAVSQAEVEENFRRYGLLDDQVRFLPGWFETTLPAAPIDRLAVLRLDGDLYGSTMDALVNLYPKLSVGGYVIVDDYVISACREAIHDYREAHGITDEMIPIDDSSVYWRRTS
ncbi:demethyldecarbamoylnovobiocin O-methyltransferase/8-demethyl-8-(2,3-dimethoxy-alpha-L-rhamnosyl)tetracenomycin-C 4'-O-methyltransferase [Streptomyces sp. 1114.5]|uniref:TylF/MycF family methyltransferase n=1 Tax=unclassified Streptomyces TaxID=2593676 RepID=UPI000BCCFF1F|nr:MULTISPECIES: TylF/MycF family methyltransferase [unclassified Streptomyces]RKT17061.1 demethyldecarbamoylnovobiocin O-methyltransferase/8-demethyl-8-(2,3-dimethoxy-alpha-L-rhamnosyl)tetracenomycin-C 4'-O-methyltransferase [Streptomyces sp. 1114.5]SOB83272.1 demethyldecarbamoylnovobiocin O-methyltransferase/8-demethyl-8-(2,3-dimethoxy-alpha-L-rhamnosyl)tetracenomycin-C 4'-O-methyltransferase [Streptomyces sp. 1331.2]